MALFRKKSPKPSALGPKEYERLGRDFEKILIKDYIEVLHSTPRQIWSAFTRGLFTGLGGVVGATVGVAVLLFVLSLFSETPFVGDIFKNLSDTIENAK